MVLPVTGAWEHPWQRNKVQCYKLQSTWIFSWWKLIISQRSTKKWVRDRKNVDGEKLQDWGAGQGGTFAVQCRIPHSMDSVPSRETWGKVLCWAGQQDKEKVHCSCMRGVRNWLGSSHWVSCWLLPQGCQQSQQCPEERGLWGRNLWEDGCGSAGWSRMHSTSTRWACSCLLVVFLRSF